MSGNGPVDISQMSYVTGTFNWKISDTQSLVSIR
jgi:hypothetical protein